MGGRTRPIDRCVARVRAAAAAAVFLSLAVTATAWAETAIEDHIRRVVPDGGELVRYFVNDGTHLTFIDSFGVDVTVQESATGAIRAIGSATTLDEGAFVTVLRLADERQAADALAALQRIGPDGMSLPAPLAPNTVLRVADYAHMAIPGVPAPEPGSLWFVEAARATGRDLVVFAQSRGEPQASPVLAAAFEAHLAAFPKVTPPAGTATSLPWVPIAGGLGALAAAVAVVAVVVRPGRARRPTSPAWQPGPAPSRPAPPFAAEPWTASPQRPRPPG